MIASLPMYDRPETAATNDKLWALVRERLGFGPETLNRDGDIWDHWQSPDLVLSQTCGMPYRTGLHGKVAIVGTPDHGLQGLAAGYYRSVLVAHKDDRRNEFSAFQGATLAYNGTTSQSGWAAPLNHAADLGIKLAIGPKTGAHAHSARAVAERRAEIAALDMVSWEMLRRWDGFSQDLKIVGVTPETPALPFITALTNDAGQIRRALEGAIAALSVEDRTLICLQGVTWIAPQDYLAVPNPEVRAN
jgi:ABC-type phosphate/phosphonate transport system substrate-binding protein